MANHQPGCLVSERWRRLGHNSSKKEGDQRKRKFFAIDFPFLKA
jgi:hypothetical protein